MSDFLPIARTILYGFMTAYMFLSLVGGEDTARRWVYGLGLIGWILAIVHSV